MKLVKKDYPFTIIVEDKIGKSSGKMYQSISIGHTVVKNKEATDPNEKYSTEWFNMFNESELLKISSLAENAYNSLKAERVAEKKQEVKQEVNDDFDSDMPF